MLTKIQSANRWAGRLLLAMAMVGLVACGKSTTSTGSTDGTDVQLVPCMQGSEDPCSSIETPYTMKVDLGDAGAIMEVNVGQGFETTVASGDSDGGLQCQLFAALFMQPADQTSALLDTMDLDLALYTVYRPAKLEKGKKYPLLTWGNGTCAQPEGYGTLLRYVASQGYIVVAANSRWVGGNSAMTKALDFMFAANDDPMSPYYKLIDTDKVGAFGHSQGAMATIAASSDPRIKTAIVFNGGTTEAAKPYLTVSGDRDIGNPTVDAYSAAVDAAAVPAAWLFYHMVPMTGSLDGHLTLMTQPERVIEPTVAWFDYQLLGDANAKKWFVGNTCKLCGNDAEYEYGEQGLK